MFRTSTLRRHARLFSDMAEANGVVLRCSLASADRLSECAIFRGSSQVNTPGSRSSAWLVSVTCCDQRCECFAATGPRSPVRTQARC